VFGGLFITFANIPDLVCVACFLITCLFSMQIRSDIRNAKTDLVYSTNLFCSANME
jgi:hypothetical protein